MSEINPMDELVIDGTVDWAGNRMSSGCSSCGQSFLINPEYLDKIKCPVCGMSSLGAQPVRIPVKNPELLAQFNSQVNPRKILEDYCSGVWLKPDDFNPEWLSTRMVRVYWPMYLIDSRVTGEWRGEAGFNYQVQSSQEFYQNGKWDTRTLMETRQRWEERIGKINRVYNNICVPAISTHTRINSLLGGADLEKTFTYSGDQSGDALIWVPDMLPAASWVQAEPILTRLVEEDCRLAAKADYGRGFNLQANYDNQNWTLILLPCFSTYYIADDGKPQIIMINGQTGKVGGVRLASQKKGWKTALIMALIAAVIMVLGFVSFLLGSVLPPAAIFGVILLGMAILLFVAAVIPAVYPWQWNSKQKTEKFTTIPAPGKK